MIWAPPHIHVSRVARCCKQELPTVFLVNEQISYRNGAVLKHVGAIFAIARLFGQVWRTEARA